jgi:hypothetical protein
MSINPTTTTVSVSDAAALIIDDESTAAGVKEDGRITYVVYNGGSDWVYLGGSDVAAGDGIALGVDGVFTISIRHGGKLYGVCFEGESAQVNVMVIP